MTDTTTLQKALITIRKLKKKLQEAPNAIAEPIAIIGLGCRFPMAENKDDFWKLLSFGINAITKLPEQRWNLLKETEEAIERDPHHPYWGSYLQNIAEFDPYFFGISPREAIRMDPQQRILLEVSYEALEDAGLPIEKLAGSNTGVFTSLYTNQYGHLQQLDSELDALFLPTGNAASIAANRLSYLYDLHGPSIVIDTACSSSLIALHLACLNLQNNLCELALVCGANINFSPSINSVLAKAKMLSPDGQCKTFDAGANGYVQGEGVGVIVLKPLSKAIEDNDKIYAIVAGSGTNQDGRTNGLTAPNGLQQEALLRAVYHSANIRPDEISYIECHGTGTFLGDPIEIQALGEVVGKNRNSTSPCWIGSVKTNIGHLEPAAGIASVIKTALALSHNQIPPHLNFSVPNPHIEFEKYHLRVPQELQPWPKYGQFRTAGISGFGFGGANAHVVLREHGRIEEKNESTTQSPELFTLSAKDPIALQQLILKWCEFIKNNPNLNLSALCYNLHVRRSHYPHRLAVIASTLSELHTALCNVKNNSTQDKNVFMSTDNKVIKKLEQNNLTQIEITELADLYVKQAAIDWNKYEEHRKFTCLDLPSYPWQHKDYWPILKKPQGMSFSNDYPLNGKQIISPLKTLQFEFLFTCKALPEIRDTYNILHAGYYLEMLSFAVNQLAKPITFSVHDLQFLMALIVPDSAIVPVQLVLDTISENTFDFYFYSYSEAQKKWLENAKGQLIIEEFSTENADNVTIIKQRCTQAENVDVLYQRILSMGMPAGESIRWTKNYWMNQDEILCEFSTPQSCQNANAFKMNVHPGIIDGCIQPLFNLVPDTFFKPYMAANIKLIRYTQPLDQELFLHGMIDAISETGDKIIGHVKLLDRNNRTIAQFEGITLSQLDNKIQIEKLMQDNSQRVDLTLLREEDRRQHIINFLTDQVAIIFSMPKSDINVNRSLKEMGIDSLMALVLMRALETGLGAPYSLSALLEGPSILQLTDAIVNSLQLQTIETLHYVQHETPWIAYRKALHHPKIRLFCFPYGGGGASIYRDWQRVLPEFVEVCPIQLPGRENRMSESPIVDIMILIEELTKHLQNQLDLPFAFFGHSFGALVAYELTHHLRKHNLPLPMHLFVSAFPDPRTPTKNLDNLILQLKNNNILLTDLENQAAIQQFSDDQLYLLSDIFSMNGIVDYGDYLLNREVVKVLLPVFFGDMSIVKSYQYHEEVPLDIPITVFLGKNDAWVDAQDHYKWREHTVRDCTFHEFDSGHLFIKDNKIKNEILLHIMIALGITQEKAITQTSEILS